MNLKNLKNTLALHETSASSEHNNTEERNILFHLHDKVNETPYCEMCYTSTAFPIYENNTVDNNMLLVNLNPLATTFVYENEKFQSDFSDANHAHITGNIVITNSVTISRSSYNCLNPEVDNFYPYMNIIDGMGADNTNVEANNLNPEAKSFHLNTSKSSLSAINETNDPITLLNLNESIVPINLDNTSVVSETPNVFDCATPVLSELDESEYLNSETSIVNNTPYPQVLLTASLYKFDPGGSNLIHLSQILLCFIHLCYILSVCLYTCMCIPPTA